MVIPADQVLCKGTEAQTHQREGLATVAFLGDLILVDNEWEQALAGSAGARQSMGELADALAGDLVVANLETTLSGSQDPIEKEPKLIGQETVIGHCLDQLGVGVAVLANNHAFDSQTSGFETVRDLLHRRRILALGAGSDFTAAATPLVIERSQVRLGFLAYADRETLPSHIAHGSSPGVNALDPPRAFDEVSELAARVDHVIVSLHWGVEYSDLPAPSQIELGRGLVDRGASLVVGHHPHVLQGIERYGNSAIAYSLGNAINSDLHIENRLAIRRTRRTCSSAVLRATFSPTELAGLEAVPFRQCTGPRILVGDRYASERLAIVNRRLARGVTPARWRRARLWEDVVLRTVGKLHPSVLGSLRTYHLTKVFRNTLRALRGRGPA